MKTGGNPVPEIYRKSALVQRTEDEGKECVWPRVEGKESSIAKKEGCSFDSKLLWLAVLYSLGSL